jgi:hypothetical protein
MNEFTESVSENDGLEENSMDGNITNGYSKGDSDRETFDARQKNLHVNGNYITNFDIGDLSGGNELSVCWLTSRVSEVDLEDRPSDES